MSDNHNSLRHEAGPIPYWKHHKRAKEALNFIIRVLKGAADSVEGSKGVGNDPTIDTNRASRIFFVSGEPGSGKSTMYLTLRAMLSSEEKYSEGYKRKTDLDDLKNVRWLDALDLEVAGDEGENLLAAVLVRLFRKLDESNPVHSSDCEDAIKKLEELATDIGIAWEGNLQARAGNLDPDTYSAEVIRTQGARLRINERLQEALDKLAKNKCYGCDEKTLFVLPVDDFYLKPAASLQLLRLLRMISIPRLFFLVMGDINTVEALFIEKSLADWTEVAGTQLFAARTDRLDDALTRARELRARYLRKLLPPGQRAVIEAMDWYEALNFETDHSDFHVDTLEDLLEQVELDQPFGTESESASESLLTFLISPSLPSHPEEKQREREIRRKRAKGEKDAEQESSEDLDLKKLRSAYTAVQILDATPREMMDFGFALREVRRKRQEFYEEGSVTVDKDQNPLLLSCVRDIVNLVREEQNFLNEKEQEVLEGILPTRHYFPEDINFAMDRLCLYPAPRTWKKQKSEQLWVRNHRSWDLTVNTKKYINDYKSKNQVENEGVDQAAKDPFAKLPPRPAAWFILLHDLAWKWNSDSVSGNLVEKLCEDLNDWRLSKSEVTLPPNQESCLQLKQSSAPKQTQNFDPIDHLSGGWAILSDGSTYQHLPLPNFKIFRDLDHFLFIWSRGLEWLGKPEEAEGSKISSIWALAGWTVLADTYKNYAVRGDDWFTDFADTSGKFEERFEQFTKSLKKKGVPFEYPEHKHTEIKEQWLDRLSEVLKQLQSGEEPSNESNNPSDNTPPDTNNQGKES
jgi:hypothetical protein